MGQVTGAGMAALSYVQKASEKVKNLDFLGQVVWPLIWWVPQVFPDCRFL